MVESEGSKKSSRSMTQRLPIFEATLSHSKIILKFHKILKANSFIIHYTFSRNSLITRGREEIPEKIKLQLKVLILSLSLHTLSTSGSNPNMQNACLHTQAHIPSISHQKDFITTAASTHVRRLGWPPQLEAASIFFSSNFSLH